MKRFKDVMKDEQGLTLIELLAVVVILAVILGIGAVGIGQVIQNSKEDAQVASVQQVIAAAQIYDAQNAVDQSIAWPTGGVTAAQLTTDGFLKNVVFKDATKVIMTKNPSTGVLSVAVQVGALGAGVKENKTLVTTVETDAGKLKRSDYGFGE